MRMDIFSFRSQNGDGCLVELHTSKSKVKQLKKQAGTGSTEAVAGEVQAKAKEVANAALELRRMEGGASIVRVIIDSDWKQVKLVDAHGNKVTRTFSDIQKANETKKQGLAPRQVDPRAQEVQEQLAQKERAEKESGEGVEQEVTDEGSVEKEQQVEKTEEIVLLATTDKQQADKLLQGGFIERGFRPVTPMEKIWKFFNNISQVLTGVAARERRAIGNFDFAVHFFSKEINRKELKAEELHASKLLSGLAEYMKDIKTSPKEATRVQQCAGWAKSIETLRDRTSSGMRRGFQHIAGDMHKAAQKLKQGDSILVPYSTFVGDQNLRSDEIQLIRITFTGEKKGIDQAKYERLYEIEFMDGTDSPPLKNIPASRLSLEDFFEPLVDIQLSESFIDMPPRGLQKLVVNIKRFAARHPKLATRILMGKTTPEKRALVTAMVQHVRSEGLVTTISNLPRTRLTAGALLNEIIRPLLGEDEHEFEPGIFESKPRMISGKRAVDSLMTFFSPEQQARAEAESLFRNYYLFEATLADDPATLAVLESGLQRVSNLYAALSIVDPQVNEMLFIVRKGLNTVKRHIHQKELHLDERVKTPEFTETFITPSLGAEYNTAKSGKTAASQEVAVSTMPAMKAEDFNSSRVRKIADSNNRAALESLDSIHEVLARVKIDTAALKQLRMGSTEILEQNETILTQNIEALAKAVTSSHLLLNNREEISTGLLDLLKILKDHSKTHVQRAEAQDKFTQTVDKIQKALQAKLESEQDILYKATIAQKETITRDIDREIELHRDTMIVAAESFQKSIYEFKTKVEYDQKQARELLPSLEDKLAKVKLECDEASSEYEKLQAQHQKKIDQALEKLWEINEKSSQAVDALDRARIDGNKQLIATLEKAVKEAEAERVKARDEYFNFSSTDPGHQPARDRWHELDYEKQKLEREVSKTRSEIDECTRVLGIIQENDKFITEGLIVLNEKSSSSKEVSDAIYLLGGAALGVVEVDYTSTLRTSYDQLREALRAPLVDFMKLRSKWQDFLVTEDEASKRRFVDRFATKSDPIETFAGKYQAVQPYREMKKSIEVLQGSAKRYASEAKTFCDEAVVSPMNTFSEQFNTAITTAKQGIENLRFRGVITRAEEQTAMEGLDAALKTAEEQSSMEGRDAILKALGATRQSDQSIEQFYASFEEQLAKLSLIKEALDPAIKKYENQMMEVSDSRLPALAERITELTNAYSKKHSEHDKETLRQELAAIFAELPLLNLGREKDFWAGRSAWKGNIEKLGQLVDMAYPAGDTHPVGFLHKGLCQALLYIVSDKVEAGPPIGLQLVQDKTKENELAKQEKLSATGKLRAALIAAEGTLRDHFLRYNTPEQQRQHLALQNMVHKLLGETEYVIEISEFDTTSHNKVRSTQNGLQLTPGSYHSARQVRISTKPQKEQAERGVAAREYYDAETRTYLDEYLSTTVETAEGSEGVKRGLAEARDGMSADEVYRWFSTNSDDPSIGLHQLILEIASPENYFNLNNTLDNLHIRLRQLALNRIQRSGHLEEYLKNQDRVDTSLEALNDAIEATSVTEPHTYVTLMQVKAALLVFLRDKYRLDEDRSLYNRYSDQLSSLVEELGTRADLAVRQEEGQKDPFKEAAVHLHTARLKIAAQLLDFGGPQTKLNPLQLMNSWIAYRTGASGMGYKDQSEEAAIHAVFYGHILPMWNRQTEAQKVELINEIMRQRNRLGEDSSLEWSKSGEVYKAQQADDVWEFAPVTGLLARNGVSERVGSEGLSDKVWKTFPLWKEGFKYYALDKIETADGSHVYNFKVDSMGETQFQVDLSKDEPLFSVFAKGSDGKNHWFQYSSLTVKEKEVPKEKEAEEKEAKPPKEGIIAQIKQVIKETTDEILAPLKKMRKELQDLGEGLEARSYKTAEKQLTVPADIRKQGIWLQKGKPENGITLDVGGNIEASVTMSHKRPFAKGASGYFSKIKSVITRDENGVQLQLVNNPHSEVYAHLMGMTSPDNIKVWADAKGTIQKIELLDPKMSFTRNAVTNQMESGDLTGFYISSDQSIPVGGFHHEWKNYLILENAAKERRLIMRQSDIVLQSYLSTTGFQTRLEMNRTAPPIEARFIDVELEKHPEKGWVAKATTPQANLYLGLAALKSEDFAGAMAFLRNAARSASYTEVEASLVRALFEYKNTSFELMLQLVSGNIQMGDELDKTMLKMVDAIKAGDSRLPQIAAAKLATLATLLQQNISESPVAQRLLPKDPAEVALWVQLANCKIPNTPLDETIEQCRLTPEELSRIALKYPDAVKQELVLASIVPMAAEEKKPVAIERADPTQVPSMPVQYVEVTEEADDGPAFMRLLMPTEERDPIISRLASGRQLFSDEKVMSFYSGEYVIRHFEQIYLQIDAMRLDNTPEGRANRQELVAIIRKLSRYKDTEPARRYAIDFLKQMALAKYNAPEFAKTGAIQAHAARNACIEHRKVLQDTMKKVDNSIDEIVQVVGGNPLDLLSNEEQQKFDGLIEKLNEQKSLLGKLAVDKIESSSELEAEINERQQSLREITSEIHALLKANIRAKGALVRGHLPGEKQPSMVRMLLQKIRGLDEAEETSSFDKPRPYKRSESERPESERTEWSSRELVTFNSNLRDLEKSLEWLGKSKPVTGFPKRKQDGFEQDRVAMFLNGHTDVTYELTNRTREPAPKAAVQSENLPHIICVPRLPSADETIVGKLGIKGARFILEHSTYSDQLKAFLDLSPDNKVQLEKAFGTMQFAGFKGDLFAYVANYVFGDEPKQAITIEAFNAIAKFVEENADTLSSTSSVKAAANELKLSMQLVLPPFNSEMPLGYLTFGATLEGYEKEHPGTVRALVNPDYTETQKKLFILMANSLFGSDQAVPLSHLGDLAALITTSSKELTAESWKACCEHLRAAWGAENTPEVKEKGRYEALKLLNSLNSDPEDLYSENIEAFCDKLSGSELVELKELKAGALPEIWNEGLKLAAESSFYQNANAFQMFKQLIARASQVVKPQDMKATCDALEAKIKAREQLQHIAGVEEPRLAPKGTIVMLDAPIEVIAKDERISFDPLKKTQDQKACRAAINEMQKEMAVVHRKQELKVNMLRQKILELANVLPSDANARAKEELRRLAQKAVEMDAETVFLAYARGSLKETLMAINPSLTSKDIEQLDMMITDHHIEATKLETFERQIGCLDKAEKFQDRFVALAEKSEYSGLLQEFNQIVVDNLNKKDGAQEAGKAFLNRLETSATVAKVFGDSPYTALKFASDAREYLKQLELLEEIGSTKRYYDPHHAHPHTKSALAYEYTLGVVFKGNQIKEFTTRVGTPDIVSWLGTGAGKTFMAPVLAKMQATGTNLVCIIDTKDLIPETSISRDKDSRAVYSQAAYHFDFKRVSRKEFEVEVDGKIEKKIETEDDMEKRIVKSLQEMKYRLLNAIDSQEYIVTSKEAIGSMLLQLYTWQRLGLNTNAYDQRIELAQDLVKIFKERSTALADEIHIILNIIETLDYSEGNRTSLSEFEDYYLTMSSIYRCIYPDVTRTGAGAYIKDAEAIADRLKIRENGQADVNEETIREAMRDTASMIVRQSLDPNYEPKDGIHEVIKKLVNDGLKPEELVEYLVLQEVKPGEEVLMREPPQQVLNLEDKKDKMCLACLKENLGSTFGKVCKKVGDENFGVNSEDGLGICPYDQGRAQPNKEFDDVFQTLQSHYMWYSMNGIPKKGLEKLMRNWKVEIEKEIGDFGMLDDCPTYKKYKLIFGNDAINIRTATPKQIADLASGARNNPALIHRFLETVVFPTTYIYPNKIGFNSMDLVLMFMKFGGMSGTIATRGSWSREISNKDDPTVDAEAAERFELVHHNPKNQKQHVLPNLDSQEMTKAARDAGLRVAPLSSQLQAAGVDVKDFHALVDISGLFKELSAIDIAKDILNQRPDLEAVLIYNDESELTIYRRGSTKLERFDSKAVPPTYDKRFTFYRQPQRTGSDVPQVQFAKFLVTVSKNLPTDPWVQGLGRARKMLEGQTFTTLYRQSLVDSIKEDAAIASAKLKENPDDPKLQAEVARLKRMIITDVEAEKESTNKLLENAEKSLSNAQAALEANKEGPKAEVEKLERTVRRAEAELSRQKAQLVWLDALGEVSKEDMNRGQLDVRAMTSHTQQTEIMLRRYYAAVSELESTLKHYVKTLACETGWRDVYREFHDLIFENSQRDVEQLLSVKVPRDPTEVLNEFKEMLVGRIDKARKNEALGEDVRQVLNEAERVIKGYILPDKEDLPDVVIGTHGESTRNVESSKQTEKATESLGNKETETVVASLKMTEEIRSDCYGAPRGDWIEWEPTNLAGLVDPVPLEPAVELHGGLYSVAASSKKIFGHIEGRNGRKIIKDLDTEILFKGLTVTPNMLQRRDYPAISMLSRGQKDARSVAEISLVKDGVRVFHHVLLDLRDHARFEQTLSRAQSIMTGPFKEAIKKLAQNEGLKDRSLEELQKNEEFRALFGEHDNSEPNMEFLVNLLGPKLSLQDLSTFSLRINMDGRYTAYAGELRAGVAAEKSAEKEANIMALDILVRKKFLCGETRFSTQEIAALTRIFEHDYLKVADTDNLTQAMKDKGIRDYSALSDAEKNALKLKIFDLFKFYAQAVGANALGEKPDVSSFPVGKILAKIADKMEIDPEEREPVHMFGWNAWNQWK